MFLVHFRPWQGGLLEDWGFVQAWDATGFAAYRHLIELTAGRPLHLLWTFLGLGISGGGFVGMFLVLGLVAVAQLLGTVWALAPVVRNRWVLIFLGLAIALHAWWPAGQVLRFLPAQVSALAVVLWIGASIRFLAGRSTLWQVLAIGAPLAGLLTYQAPAGALCVGAVAISAVHGSTIRRRLWHVGLTVCTVVAAMAWSAVIAPRISPDSYESGLMTAPLDVRRALCAIARTLAIESPELLIVGAILALIIIVLLGRTAIATWQALVLLACVFMAPLTAMSFAFNLAHLNDPERVAQPVGMTLWIVATAVSILGAWRTRLPHLIASVGIVASTAGAMGAYSTWTAFAELQQALLTSVAPIRSDASPSTRLVVEDLSGEFGDVYTFLPPHLNIAFYVEEGPGATVTLCTPADVPRDHPIAARFPITTTPTCEDLLVGKTVERVETVDADGRALRVLIVSQRSLID
ncbi:hypothetical protein ET495_09190 [Xylanimonas allomyrinae]|uniref:Uncharacterized protein n=1 Tax=Xylanimonas allomyrinae TaxID=2509459 RepID=A0A4P6EM79_9MICO|nr:hypothetical protein [Xylanimonas allomyrinae]QAY63396.1 hypothetical protein ET495_09190 [Xylanimonas allomyrinae]